MSAVIPVVAIFDIGKTNKKFLLFNQRYEVVFETSTSLQEIQDEDGEPCEDLVALITWVRATAQEASQDPRFHIEAINFSTYGASFVHLGMEGRPVAPLYNYLKKFPESLKNKFYSTYGDETQIARATASPVLGNLNSGMQLYMIKALKPALFKQIKISLHLPQFISSLFTGHFFSDITSIGCHTQLWDFEKRQYHQWVITEELDRLLPTIAPSNSIVQARLGDRTVDCGIGLHDSSAALIPYLKKYPEPFLLLSTGTWCISLNPFNAAPLTADELAKDCLCYLSFEGVQVKASRLFSGHEHEVQVKKLARHFNTADDFYTRIRYQPSIPVSNTFDGSDYSMFETYEVAYHHVMHRLVSRQVNATQWVLNNSSVTRIFVDGGFSKNELFMNLLAKSFPNMDVYATEVAQASALGAALALDWKSAKAFPELTTKKYPTS